MNFFPLPQGQGSFLPIFFEKSATGKFIQCIHLVAKNCFAGTDTHEAIIFEWRIAKIRTDGPQTNILGILISFDKFPNVRKIGRNTLCPCGSGKKFKRCCSGTNRLAYSLKTEINLEIKVIPKPWIIGETKIIRTDSFEQFFFHEIGLSENHFLANLTEVYESVRNIGWLRRKPSNILLECSDSFAQEAIKQTNHSLLSSTGFQLSTKPFDIGEMKIGQAIGLFPKRIKEFVGFLPAELKLSGVLSIVCHEFGHACGLAYVPDEVAETQKMEKFDLLADSVSFKVNYREDAHPKYYSMFSYLLDAFDKEQFGQPSNESLSKFVDDVLQENRTF